MKSFDYRCSIAALGVFTIGCENKKGTTENKTKTTITETKDGKVTDESTTTTTDKTKTIPVEYFRGSGQHDRKEDRKENYRNEQVVCVVFGRLTIARCLTTSGLHLLIDEENVCLAQVNGLENKPKKWLKPLRKWAGPSRRPRRRSSASRREGLAVLCSRRGKKSTVPRATASNSFGNPVFVWGRARLNSNS